MKLFKYIIFSFIICVLLLAAGLAGKVWHWAKTPAPMSAEVIDYNVPRGSTIASVAREMAAAGIRIEPYLFVMYARYTGQDRQLKAGAYEARRGDTPVDLLSRMASGQTSKSRFQIIEGWSYNQIRTTLKNNPNITQTLDNVSDAELLEMLGAPYDSPEGLFFPETYVFVPGDTDMDILRRAYTEGQQRLAAVWDQRDSGLPLKTPYDALILASIIEKETGHQLDRRRVAGVFINRLERKMLLQTDPTVIYGMKDTYQGVITRSDLRKDTPWNTYTRTGLPPTPIASPGMLSLQAAVHPEQHKYLYFVSRGDGSSEFSEDLRGHNRNVNTYILKKGIQ
ncbi:aminodeoxychorismate lyase [Advenella sp. S44]|uniref:endolytic transglycosylase MltG n=1 Tax=Advenella sp. S44 TaxID=1982755 RepID=UPI000C29DAAA|nr:endolytic transglycosylase MltG [Advenella sp. S44]PJX26533.1 aminodeoxychorismate lyase [Advenella sp. S44]